MTDGPSEVRERLLKAWRGEVVAGGAYGLIAQRMPDREAEILRRMAQDGERTSPATRIPLLAPQHRELVL
jgi:hypothetical protein